jgi:DNA repair protein RecO (recombination protein O)
LTKENDHTVHAISLRVVKYGETSLIAACYTQQYGLQSYMLKGILSNTRKKKISKSLFEPLTLLELQASKNSENRLGYIKEAKRAQAFHSIPFDITKKALVFFMAEVLHQVDHQNELGLFHIKMMLDLTRFIGFSPNLNLPEAPYFDLESGCMTPDKPLGLFLEDPLKSFWIQLLGTDFDRVGEIQLSRQFKNALLKSVISYYELHLQQFKAPKSTEVLNEIFKTL